MKKEIILIPEIFKEDQLKLLQEVTPESEFIITNKNEFNDEMLEKANQGIVFEGAKEKLLDIAYDTFKDPDQDGIALSLEKLGLI